MEGENDLNTKKLIALLLCAAMAASILCACQLSGQRILTRMD